MLWRLLGRLLGATVLMASVWVIGSLPDPGARPWIRPVGEPRGPVRIVRFYASTPRLAAGETAQLCYGVENARTVRISPAISKILPAGYRCVQIAPDHTTHYTILAEGFDGSVVTQPLTLVVEPAPQRPQPRRNFALVRLREPAKSL